MTGTDPAATIEDARRALAAADARTEALGRYEPEHRRLRVFTVAERIVPDGRAWRLGVLLLATDGRPFLTGTTTRAHRLVRVGYTAESQRRRDELRDAAARGGFDEGTTVNFDLAPVRLDDWAATPGGLCVVRADVPCIRWAAHAPVDAAVPLADYLAERVELLTTPPTGGA